MSDKNSSTKLIVFDDNTPFPELIAHVRKSDHGAAAELVRRYAPKVRRAVRFRLTDPELRRTCDSLDVCQLVLGSFFVRAAMGQYDLDTPENLVKLLTTMARNKVLNLARTQPLARRDNRLPTDEVTNQDREHAARRENRLVTLDITNHDVASPQPGPDRQVEAKELLQEVFRRLPGDVREWVELRIQGDDWNIIAAKVGGDAKCLRARLSRELGKLKELFGLEEGEDE